MKQAYRSLFAGAILLLVAASGCASLASAPPSPAQGAPTAASTRPSSVASVSASVEVEPAHTSEMAFLIQARVKEVKVKAGDQVTAGQELIVLDTPDLEYAVVSAQAEADSAQKNDFLQRSTREYKIWQGHKWIWTHGIQEVRIMADARLEQALGVLEVAKANLAQGTLTAPFDGTVVSIDVVPGEMVEPNKAVLVMGDLDHLQIATTDLSEREIAPVRIGQPATTRLKAFPQALTGKVVDVAPFATEYKGDTVFKVTVQLDQQPEDLLWGMTGDVEIQTQ